MKSIVLLSGGLDSAVVLGLVKEKHDDIIALNMYYGQHNDKELDSAKKIAKHYNVPLLKMDLTPVFKNMKSAMLKVKPNEDENFYVPARNSIFLSIAAGIADSLGADTIYYGAHRDDAGGYPDTTLSYLKKINEALKEGTVNRVSIKAPFINKDKSKIVETGHRLNVPMELTHSCYMNQTPPCGKCDTCKLRAAAFKKAGIKDPAYSKEEI